MYKGKSVITIYDNYTTTLGYIKFDNTERSRSPSKLYSEDNQDLSIFNEMAVITVWHDDFNNVFEEAFNEEEHNGENLAEEGTIYKFVVNINLINQQKPMEKKKHHDDLPNGCKNFAESDINETEDGQN